MRSIKWESKAYRQVKKIKDAKLQLEIYDAVECLVNFPDCKNVKKLIGFENMYRLKVKRYRVIFTDALEIIRIEEVKKRDERTY
jgi:mRNA-degrading endonuclease RelE of RelBE toxin-antitoxin system